MLKFQNSSTKITDKSQAPSTKLQINYNDQNNGFLVVFGILVIWYWNLFEIWDLLFGILSSTE
jgi:hypothetical protein